MRKSIQYTIDNVDSKVLKQMVDITLNDSKQSVLDIVEDHIQDNIQDNIQDTNNSAVIKKSTVKNFFHKIVGIFKKKKTNS